MGPGPGFFPRHVPGGRLPPPPPPAPAASEQRRLPQGSAAAPRLPLPGFARLGPAVGLGAAAAAACARLGPRLVPGAAAASAAAGAGTLLLCDRPERPSEPRKLEIKGI